jgi:hypothetical protein
MTRPRFLLPIVRRAGQARSLRMPEFAPMTQVGLNGLYAFYADRLQHLAIILMSLLFKMTWLRCKRVMDKAYWKI